MKLLIAEGYNCANCLTAYGVPALVGKSPIDDTKCFSYYTELSYRTAIKLHNLDYDYKLFIDEALHGYLRDE